MRCRALERFVNLGAAVALVAGATAAVAQEAPEDRTPPPPSAGSATDEQPPPHTLPPCPPKEQVMAPMPPPEAPPEAPPPTHAAHHNIVFAPQEISLTTGAGPANYFGSNVNGTIDVGAGWDARVTFGARSILALEAGYVGGYNNFDNASQDITHARLNSHGLDGDLRLQVPTVVEPYIFGGVGYNHMQLESGNISTSDDQVAIPAGGGVSGYIGKHATVDLRGTYRFIPDNGLNQMGTTHLHQWVAQARVGYVF